VVGWRRKRKKGEEVKAHTHLTSSLFRRNNVPSFEPKQTYLFVLRFNIFYNESVKK